MRALRILLAATLTLLAAVPAAQAQRVSPSPPAVSGGGGFTPQNRHPSFYFNPKEMTIEKAKPWKNKNQSKLHPGQGPAHCKPPNC